MYFSILEALSLFSTQSIITLASGVKSDVIMTEIKTVFKRLIVPSATQVKMKQAGDGRVRIPDYDGKCLQVQVQTRSGNIICFPFLWRNETLMESQNLPGGTPTKADVI